MKRIALIFSLIALSIVSVTAQTAKQTTDKTDSAKVKSQIKISVTSQDKSPLILIDGKQYDKHILELIDPDKIDKITVFKDKDSLDKYNAPYGLVKITTKNALSEKKPELSGKVKSIRIKGNLSKDKPLVILNGTVCNDDTLKKIDPKDIESINVLKGEAAIMKYQSPDGVILITTKKGK